MTPLRQLFIETLTNRNYSTRTIEAYVFWVAAFARLFGKSPEVLGPDEIHKFQVWLQSQRRTSWSAFNQAMCALRFLYREVLLRPDVLPRIHFMRRERKLPVVLSPEEVSALLSSVHDLVQRTILTTIYACGLRLGEALSLRIGDIDPALMIVHVRLGKGRKDRNVGLSPVLLQMLRAYCRAKHPSGWLFPSRRDPSKPFHPTSVQKAIRAAAQRAGITKAVSPHTLRHSYATHAMNDGAPMRVLQVALGHRSINTTQLYTHVSPEALIKMRSPLDTLPPPPKKRR